ncbi:MAG: hypothetical protein WC629_00270 [Candidatus Paceibacterota bacterium]|jgi:hypothetical protein
MTLGTHAVVGASLATLLPSHPVLAFTAGFLSHFVLDSIPHWDYKLLSISKDENNKMNTDMVLGSNFIIDIFRIGFDIYLGLSVAFLVVGNLFYPPFVLLAGAIGAMLPDTLQFVYFKFKREPLRSLQKFHMFMHAETRIHNPVKGIFFQIITVIVAVLLVSVVKTFL